MRALLPANQTPRSVRVTASSFFAGKPGSYRYQLCPVGARLARESSAAVRQADRVIVHRGQATLPQGNACPCPRDADTLVCQGYRVIVLRGQARHQQTAPSCGSEACPRIKHRGSSGRPRYRSSRASHAPTGECVPLCPRFRRLGLSGIPRHRFSRASSVPTSPSYNGKAI